MYVAAIMIIMFQLLNPHANIVTSVHKVITENLVPEKILRKTKNVCANINTNLQLLWPIHRNFNFSV